jgi:hypothetical protein
MNFVHLLLIVFEHLILKRTDIESLEAVILFGQKELFQLIKRTACVEPGILKVESTDDDQQFPGCNCYFRTQRGFLKNRFFLKEILNNLELFKAEILEVEFELLTMRNGNSGFG